MNTALNMPPFSLKKTAEPFAFQASAADAARERAQELARSAAEDIESLRQASLKLLKQAGTMGAAAAAASLEAIRAIWHAVMSFLRFIARIFGRVPAPSVDKDAAAEAADASAKDMDSVASPIDDVSSDSAIEALATEAQATIDAAARANTPEASAFLQALNFAGIGGAGAALLLHAQNPEAFSAAKAPNMVIGAALQKAAEAISALEPKILHAQLVRSQAAAKMSLSQKYEPPLLVEDLIAIVRRAVADDFLSGEEKAAAAALVESDDALLAILGHKNMISETMVLASASALLAGVELSDHHELLSQVVGDDWLKRVTSASGEFSSSPSTDTLIPADPVKEDVANKVYEDLLGRMAVPKEPGEEAQSGMNESAQQAAADFFSPETQGPKDPVSKPGAAKPLSVADRLRLSSRAAEKYFPVDSFDKEPNDGDELKQ